MISFSSWNTLYLFLCHWWSLSQELDPDVNILHLSRRECKCWVFFPQPSSGGSPKTLPEVWDKAGHFPSAQIWAWALAGKLFAPCLFSDAPTRDLPWTLSLKKYVPNRLVLHLPKGRLLWPQRSPRKAERGRGPLWEEFNLSTSSPAPLLPSNTSGPTRQ